MSWKEALWPEWQIVRQMGSGSFGTVYEIVRQDIGGTYRAALKVIQTPADEEERQTVRDANPSEHQLRAYYLHRAEKLSNEISLMERMKGHSHIVSYEDHKIHYRDNGEGFDLLLRMELLTPLWEYLQSHPCQEQDAIRMGRDLCSALALCQKERIIHRDIKPGNIFVTRFGEYKLGDFGIARVMSECFAYGSATGTYQYMAPELYHGQPYDQTIDLYSLGLVLYRMLNYGRAPFLPLPPAAVEPEMLIRANRDRLLGRPLPPPAAASERMAAVVLKACACRPSERFQNAEEMRAALDACERGPQIRPGPKSILSAVSRAMTELLWEDSSTCGEAGTAPPPPSPLLPIQQECPPETPDVSGMNEFFAPPGDL